MAKNRFEQVDEIQPDAITLSLSREEGKEGGKIIFPASASDGRMAMDQISAHLPPVDAFRGAVRLANQMKVAIVVVDPGGLWQAEWGELYRAEGV
jgi:hypothetical protein